MIIKNTFQKTGIFLFFLIILLICATKIYAEPLNIILFIGDGMGQYHRLAAQWASVGKNQLLQIDSLPVKGLSRTHSANKDVTDSAAGATAIATGHKTNNDMIAMSPDLKPLITILEQAEKLGKSTGLVTNTPISHATPAAFASHVPDREMMVDIAAQMMASQVEVLMGGGEDEFLPVTEIGHYPKQGKRKDGHNLIKEAQSAGYTIIFDDATLQAVPDSTLKIVGLFADEGLIFPHSPNLADMTKQAIVTLSKNSKGFFLMVESGQIDWESHANDARKMVENVKELDKAVGVALDFAKTHNTLLIVAADHETGGLSIDLTKPTDNSPDEVSFDENSILLMPDNTPFYATWTTEKHTARDVPITAQGHFSELLSGTYENTHIYEVMYQAFNCENSQSAKCTMSQ